VVDQDIGLRSANSAQPGSKRERIFGHGQSTGEAACNVQITQGYFSHMADSGPFRPKSLCGEYPAINYGHCWADHSVLGWRSRDRPTKWAAGPGTTSASYALGAMGYPNRSRSRAPGCPMPARWVTYFMGQMGSNRGIDIRPFGWYTLVSSENHSITLIASSQNTPFFQSGSSESQAVLGNIRRLTPSPRRAVVDK